MKSKPICLILCGGYSTRMQQPKHQIRLGCKMLWVILSEKAIKAGFQPVISCRSDQVKDFKNARTIVDAYSDIGPMGGVLSSFESTNKDSILVLSCDVPNINTETLIKLWDENNPTLIATCAKANTSEFPEPLVAVWNRSALRPLLGAQSDGDYSLMKTLNSHPITKMTVESNELANLNTIDDLKSIREL